MEQKLQNHLQFQKKSPNGSPNRIFTFATTANVHSDYESDQDQKLHQEDETALKAKEKVQSKFGVGSLDQFLDQYCTEEERNRFLKLFEVTKVLGNGGFGVVLQGIDKINRKNIAIKMAWNKMDKGTMLAYEYSILKYLDHPNIIKAYYYEAFSEFIVVTMKLAKENLRHYVQRRIKNNRPLTDEEASKVMKGFLEGLAYMHDDKNIIHRDLKPDNIIIGDYKDLSKCKIIDFGIAVNSRRSRLEKFGNIGTLIYQPPEQALSTFNYGKVLSFQVRQFLQGADIWAAGIICFFIMTGRHPFISEKENSLEKCKQLILTFKSMKFRKEDNISPQAQHFIKHLITKEQSHRYTASEALTHPWITRDFNSPYPLTRFQQQDKRAEDFKLETNLKRVLQTIYFMGMTRLYCEPIQVDIGYKLKLRSSHLDIQIVRSSTLFRKEKFLELSKPDSMEDVEEEEFEQEQEDNQNQTNNQPLSPNVKKYLKTKKVKNYYEELQMMKGNEEKGDVKRSKTKRSKKQENNQDELSLNVPKKRQRRKSAVSNSDVSSISSQSPAELQLSVSGMYSDLNDSMDFDNPEFQVKLNKQEDISLKESIMHKFKSESPQVIHGFRTQGNFFKQQTETVQPKDVLSKIKEQKVDIRHLKKQTITKEDPEPKLQFQKQQTQSQKYLIKKKLNQQDSLESHFQKHTISLVQTIQEEILEEEEKKLQKRLMRGNVSSRDQQRRQSVKLQNSNQQGNINSITPPSKANDFLNRVENGKVKQTKDKSEVKFKGQNVNQYIKKLKQV